MPNYRAKPLDLLNKLKPSIAARCSAVVEGIRKLTSPEATAMAAAQTLEHGTAAVAAELQDAVREVRTMAVETLGRLTTTDLATHAGELQFFVAVHERLV
eukprot:5787226-Prymnesium_polylepis.1